MHSSEIRIRDPFVLPVPETGEYFLYGTTDANCWGGDAVGFDCYRSRDLENWDGPFPVFRPPAGFWGTSQFWAPECHRWRGGFYLFASFNAPHRHRGTQILRADSPLGPFMPISDGPVTPPDCECLDGTFFVDESGNPWIVYCHEWTQIRNGSICAVPLSGDLTRAVGRRTFLFNASEAPWVRRPPNNLECAPGLNREFPVFVTDGPFLFRSKDGSLLMLWSSFGASGYAMGCAKSADGTLVAEWTQRHEPLWGKDGGHGMLFRRFDGRLMLTFHTPNDSPRERPVFVEAEDVGGDLRLL